MSSTTLTLNKFRQLGNETSCSAALVNDKLISGGNLGEIYFISTDEKSSLSQTRSAGNNEIEAVASSHSGDKIAIACNKSISIYNSNMDETISLAVRCTLIITHIEFDHDDNHM